MQATLNIQSESGKTASIDLKGHTSDSLHDKVIQWFGGEEITYEFVGFPASVNPKEHSLDELLEIANK